MRAPCNHGKQVLNMMIYKGLVILKRKVCIPRKKGCALESKEFYSGKGTNITNTS